MRGFLAAVAALALCGHAAAGSEAIDAQWTLNGGANQGTGKGCTGWVPGIGQPCTSAVGRIIGWAGTFTVKNPGVEALWEVACNNEVVILGESFQGTTPIVSPAMLPPELTGPCWIQWQADSPTPGTGIEIQLVIFNVPN